MIRWKPCSLIGCFLLTIGTVAAEDLRGPVYPPPGGADFSSSGTGEGDPGGITWTLSEIQVDKFLRLFWGPQGADSVQVSLDGGALNTLVFSASESSLPAMARWMGTAHYVHPRYGDQGNIPVRFTMTQIGDTNLQTAPAEISGSGAVLDVMDAGSSFTVNLLFEADWGGWQPINLLEQPPGGYTRTEFLAGFYYELEHLLLEATPTVSSGDTLTWKTWGGGPGKVGVLFIGKVNGLTYFRPIHQSTFDADGIYLLSVDVPPGLPVVTVSFLTFGLKEDDSIDVSNYADVQFQ